MEKAGSKFFSWLDKFETFAVTVLLGTMTIVVFLQVFSRFVLKGSLPWSEEVARYLMVWAVFIGASIGAKTGAHIGVEAFVRLFPPAFQRPMIVLSCFFTVLFCGLVVVLSSKVVLNIYQAEQVSPAMEMPMHWAYLAVPVGALLMSIRFIQAAVSNWRREGGISA